LTRRVRNVWWRSGLSCARIHRQRGDGGARDSDDPSARRGDDRRAGLARDAFARRGTDPRRVEPHPCRHLPGLLTRLRICVEHLSMVKPDFTVPFEPNCTPATKNVLTIIDAVPAQKPIRSGNRFADEDRDVRFLISRIEHWPLLRPGDHAWVLGAIASERNNCKTERPPTSKRLRLFGRRNRPRGASFVAIVQTAHLWEGDNGACRGWLYGARCDPNIRGESSR
jgi:hypothetical protein